VGSVSEGHVTEQLEQCGEPSALDANDRPIDHDRIQRIRRMMELERQLTRTRQRGLRIER
jgi:hypothetical protein